DPVRARLKGLVGGQIQQTALDLQSQHAVDIGSLRDGCSRMAAVDPDTATVRGQFFDVVDPQASHLEDPLHSMDGQVRKVLVIDRIELVVLDQAQQVRKFQRD